MKHIFRILLAVLACSPAWAYAGKTEKKVSYLPDIEVTNPVAVSYTHLQLADFQLAVILVVGIFRDQFADAVESLQLRVVVQRPDEAGPVLSLIHISSEVEIGMLRR